MEITAAAIRPAVFNPIPDGGFEVSFPGWDVPMHVERLSSVLSGAMDMNRR